MRLDDTDADRLMRMAKLVKAMRAMQRRYFDGDRSKECLSLSKDLERRVDRAVAWVLGDRSVQGELLPREPPGAPGAYGPRSPPPRDPPDSK